MDTTGTTSDVGKDYALGMDEVFKFINEQGGVNGKKIKYICFGTATPLCLSQPRSGMLTPLGLEPIISSTYGVLTLALAHHLLPLPITLTDLHPVVLSRSGRTVSFKKLKGLT